MYICIRKQAAFKSAPVFFEDKHGESLGYTRNLKLTLALHASSSFGVLNIRSLFQHAGSRSERLDLISYVQFTRYTWLSGHNQRLVPSQERLLQWSDNDGLSQGACPNYFWLTLSSDSLPHKTSCMASYRRKLPLPFPTSYSFQK